LKKTEWWEVSGEMKTEMRLPLVIFSHKKPLYDEVTHGKMHCSDNGQEMFFRVKTGDAGIKSGSDVWARSRCG
jgi:hypothetical protein